MSVNYVESLEITQLTLGYLHPEYATTLDNLAVALHRAGYLEEADTFFQESLYIKEKTLEKDHPEYARTFNNLGMLHIDMGMVYRDEEEHLNKAEDYFKKSLTIHATIFGKEHPHYATVAHNLCLLYSTRGLFEKTITGLLEVANIKEKTLGKNHIEYISILFDLGLIYEQMRHMDSAVTHFTEAFNLLSSQLEEYYPILSEKEKLQHLKNNLNHKLQGFYSFVLRNNEFNSKLIEMGATQRLRSKGLALSTSNNTRQSIMRSEDSLSQKLYNDWLSIRRQIAYMNTLPLKKRNTNLLIWENQVDSLEKVLNRKLPNFESQFKNMHYVWRDVQNKLKQNEAAISFIDFRYHNGKRWTDTTYYVAIVILPKELSPQLIKLCTKETLMPFLNYSNAQQQYTYISDVEKGYDFYKLIWEPLTPLLADITKIYFSPSGLLNKIAFHAIRAPDGKLLMNKYDLNQYSALGDFIEKKTH